MPPAASASATSRFGRLGVDPGEVPAVELDQPPGEAELAPRVRRSARARPSVPGAFSPSIAPGVGAMRRHLAAVFQHDVGEESFIPPQQRAADERAGEAHRRTLRRAPRGGQAAMPNPTAAMLTIGDEILSGRTRDTNMPHLAAGAGRQGHRPPRDPDRPRRRGRDRRRGQRAPRPLHPRLHLGRHRPDPRRHHRRLRSPRPSASAIDVREDARAILAANYANPEVDLNPARLRMARIPDGAELIENPVSQGAGLQPRQRARDGRRAGGLRGDGGGPAAEADRRAAAPLARPCA